MHPSLISIENFTYYLPQDRIAVYPLEQRDASKLLVYKGGKISEHIFREIDQFLEPDTMLVFNQTKVMPARLHFVNTKGQEIEVFCLEPHDAQSDLAGSVARKGSVRWNCLVGNLKRWKEEALILTKDELTLRARIRSRESGYVVMDLSWEPSQLSFSDVLEQLGHIPIPPYLKRESELTDHTRYQTVYAKEKGSVAAPTAGLHFTDQVFDQLKKRAVYTEQVTLHVGAGTFMPVKSVTMQDHVMHAEWIEVERDFLERLLQHGDKKIIAVGTTSLRTMESLYWMGLKALKNQKASLQDLELRQWDAYEPLGEQVSRVKALGALLAWMDQGQLSRLVCRTQILIAPPYDLKIADGIITNFHQPQSTLLLLISAIVGDRWKEIYTYALDNGFRFLSYGDSSLLLK